MKLALGVILGVGASALLAGVALIALAQRFWNSF